MRNLVYIFTHTILYLMWLQLFGYIQTSAEEAEEIMVGEEVSIFTVSKRRRVGEAAGRLLFAYKSHD